MGLDPPGEREAGGELPVELMLVVRLRPDIDEGGMWTRGLTPPFEMPTTGMG